MDTSRILHILINKSRCRLNSTNEYTHATVRVPTAEPSTNPIKWKTFSKHCCQYNDCHAITNTNEVQMDTVFANCSEMVKFTFSQQQKLQQPNGLMQLIKTVIDQGLEIKLIENTLCVCKDGWLVIPKPLQRQAIMWYHHYLQHTGHTHLEETMNAVMYWKGMCTTIRSITNSCKTCQVNKRWKHKHRDLPAKLVIGTPWECLCVDLISPYTIKGKGSSLIDFMALTMIDPTSSWFEIMKSPLIKWFWTLNVNGKELVQS
jgi:hypothetical protein